MTTDADVNEKKAVLKGKSEDFDQEIYASVASSAELRELALIDSKYKISPFLFWKADEDGAVLKSRFDGEHAGCKFDIEKGFLAGGYDWVAEIRIGRKQAVRLKAQFMLVYHGLAGQPEQYVEAYFEKIARFTTYPYFRSLFATNTSLSNVPLPPLPSLIDRVD